MCVYGIFERRKHEQNEPIISTPFKKKKVIKEVTDVTGLSNL